MNILSLCARVGGRLAALVCGCLLVLAPTHAAPAAALQLSGRTLDGQPVDLARLRGKVVMLFIWSTRCPVCLDKLPELRRNVEGWRGRDFVLLAVGQDRQRDDIDAYARVLAQLGSVQASLPLMWRHDPAHHDTLGELPLSQPTTLLIDREGRVVRTLTGRVPAAIWDDVADLLLNP